MYEKVLQKLREKIRQCDYVVTSHADEEMYADGLTIWDVEDALLGGEIIERQRDHWIGEWKYVVRGKARDLDVALVTKIGYNQRLVIITVYLLER